MSFLVGCKPVSGKENFEKPEGCILGYQSKEFQYAQSGHLLAPWVAITFVDTALKSKDDPSVITVSNQSSQSTDPPNCAVIKSFTFGHSDGIECKVIIHDTHGGNFEEFMRHLLTDWYCTIQNTAQVYMKFQFGWVKSGCTEPIPASMSPCYYCMCMEVNTNFSEGKFIFEISGKDLGHTMPEGSAEWETGGEGQESVYLTDAITQFMTDPNSPGPNISEIHFEIGTDLPPIKFGPNQAGNKDKVPLFNVGTTDEEKFYGRKTFYQAHGKNKLEVIKKWVLENPSSSGKPWIMKNNPEGNGIIIFQEVLGDPANGQNLDDSYFDNLSLGTFIVNGGPMSPVIEFNPKIKWNFAMITAGASGNAGDLNANPLDTPGGKNPGSEAIPKDKFTKGAGQPTGTQTSDAKLNEGGKPVVEDAKMEALESLVNPITFHSISADLVINGDPAFCPPRFAMRTYVSIVLINPFHISQEGGGPCGDWYLAEQPCNHVLSNKGWIVMSVTHQIDAGKYTTNINVVLQAPGADYDKDANLGGWTKGWKPNQCI